MSNYKYKNFDIELVENNNIIYLEIYSFGQALGHTRWNGTKTCQNPRIAVIDALAKKAKAQVILLEGRYCISQSDADAIIEASQSQEKEKFKKWFTSAKKRLKEGNTKALIKSSEKHFKYSTALRRRKVILTTNVTELEEVVKEIILSIRYKDVEERIKVINHLSRVILERKDLERYLAIQIALTDIISKERLNITKKIEKKYKKELEKKDFEKLMLYP